MRCASCGHENRETARFCEACGAKLALSCPQCGAEVRPGARFCDSCGHRLPEAPAAPVGPATTATGAAPVTGGAPATGVAVTAGAPEGGADTPPALGGEVPRGRAAAGGG